MQSAPNAAGVYFRLHRNAQSRLKVHYQAHTQAQVDPSFTPVLHSWQGRRLGLDHGYPAGSHVPRQASAASQDSAQTRISALACQMPQSGTAFVRTVALQCPGLFPRPNVEHWELCPANHYPVEQSTYSLPRPAPRNGIILEAISTFGTV